MEHFRNKLIIFLLITAACHRPASRLHAVQVGGCYIEKNNTARFAGLSKTCFFAVQGWQNSPAQRLQLDSLAAKTILTIASEGNYENGGVIYYKYDEDINEHTKHSINYNTMYARGDRVASYSWNNDGEYGRLLWDDGNGRWLPDSLQGTPSIIVDIKTEKISGKDTISD